MNRITEYTEKSVVLRHAALEAIVVLEKIAQRLDLDVEQETASMRRQLTPHRAAENPGPNDLRQK